MTGRRGGKIYTERERERTDRSSQTCRQRRKRNIRATSTGEEKEPEIEEWMMESGGCRAS